jgi:hypothetical protein
MDREQAEALHDEVDRLPRTFRLPIVLCYFEGLTLDEAAHRLRWPAGTLRSRLARARDKLRRGLTRRGVVLSSAAMAAALSPRSTSASLSSPLCDATTQAASQFAAGQAVRGAVSISATALAQEVLRSMLFHKLRLTAMTVLLLGAVATGAGYLTHSLAMKDEPRRTPAGPRAAAAAQPERPAAGRMFVTGRVLDPQGKPVPHATTMVYARSKAMGHTAAISRMNPVPIADARADSSGRFRIDAPRTSSSRYDTFGAVAIAPGYGVGWAVLDPDADQPAADITLRPEQVIQGRLFDLQGRPVPDVTISVWLISRPWPRDRTLVREDFDGVAYQWSKRNDFPAWPKPARTDAAGRFTLRGVGRNLHVFLAVHHPRFALQRIELETDGASESKPLTMGLEPAKIIKGRVTYADSSQSVPHVLLSVSS